MRALLLAACFALACGQSAGYRGPLPSVEARVDCMTPLRGLTYVDTTGAFGGGPLTVVGFIVGAQPTITLERPAADAAGKTRYWVVVLTDGDLADFYQRVTGTRAPEYEGPLSEDYRLSLGL